MFILYQVSRDIFKAVNEQYYFFIYFHKNWIFIDFIYVAISYLLFTNYEKGTDRNL